MKKIMKALKWYFSHVNWKVVAFIFILLNLVTLIDGDFPNMMMNVGLLGVVLLIPIYAMSQRKIQQSNKERKIEVEKMFNKWEESKEKSNDETQKKITIEYLSKISHANRLEILKEVQEKTKGK